MLDLPAHLTVTKLSSDAVVECSLCGETKKLADMRKHVGVHILRSLREIDESSKLKPGVTVSECFHM